MNIDKNLLRAPYALAVFLLISLMVGIVFFVLQEQRYAQMLNTQFARLQRGVNIYYTVTEKDGQLVNLEDPLNHIDQQDVLRIQQAGLTHVRLAFSPYPLMHGERFDAALWQTPNAMQYLHNIHRLIELFVTNNITVVLAVMPSDASYGQMHRTPESVGQWVGFFHAWGREFARYPVSSLLFETLNEPRFLLSLAQDARLSSGLDTGYPDWLFKKANAEWEVVERQLLGALRAEAPGHTLIATADGFSSPAALAMRAPLEDGNIIYAFHYYHPLSFTHQSADWSQFPASRIEGLAYPPGDYNCARVKNSVRPQDQAVIARYCKERWGVLRHQKDMLAVSRWAKKFGVHVWLSEFGAFPFKTDGDSVSRYYHDIVAVAQNNGFGWCAWEYANWLGRLENITLGEATPAPESADR